MPAIIVRKVKFASPVIQPEIQGEEGTGFEKAGDLGEFECGNCKYYSGGLCDQKTMKAKSKQPRSTDGRVVVEAEDCCEYVKRIGRKDGE